MELPYPVTLVVPGEDIEEAINSQKALIGRLAVQKAAFAVVVATAKPRDAEKVDVREALLALRPEGVEWDVEAIAAYDAVIPRKDTTRWLTGVIAGEFLSSPRQQGTTAPRMALLQLSIWPAAAGALIRHIAEHLAETQDARDVCRTLDGLSGTPDKALDGIADALDRWERRFRRGESLTVGIHEAMDAEMEKLRKLRPTSNRNPIFDTRREGLETRLVRLIDAQSSRDASGALERVVSVVGSLVLVPGLVASVYGANVAVPLKDAESGWSTMLAFMALGGVLTYASLSALRPSARTRRLSLHVPGAPRLEDDQDMSCVPRLLLCVLIGGAGGTTVNALHQHRVLREAPTTGYALVGGLALLLLATVLIAKRDHRQRSCRHVAIDLFVVFASGMVAYQFLRDQPVVGVIFLAALGAIFGPWAASKNLRKRVKGWVKRQDGG